jgi:protein-tyrosine-phosphatase
MKAMGEATEKNSRGKSAEELCNYKTGRIQRTNPGKRVRERSRECYRMRCDRFEVESVGTRPGHVRPEAIAVMKELGIDISGHRSKHVQEFENQSFDYVLTVCDNARKPRPPIPPLSGHVSVVSK